MGSTLTVTRGLERRNDNFLWLRIIAALMVIYGHSFPLMRTKGLGDIFLRMNWGSYSGDIAVDIFFVVSGFMVSGSWLRRSDLYQFSRARVLRIIPALLICLVISAYVIGPFFTHLSTMQYLRSGAVLDYIAQNLKFSSNQSYRLPGVFIANVYPQSVNGSLWTLPAELHMYILVAILGATGLFRSRTLIVTVLSVLLAMGIFWPWLLPLHEMWIRLGGYFVLGIAVQVYKDKIEVRHVTMLVLVYTAYLCRRAGIYPWIFALSITYFCFWFAYSIKLPSIEKYGDPSYGAYLWGWPVLQMFSVVFPRVSPGPAFVACSVVALALGYLSWHLVERPVLRLKGLSFRRMAPARNISAG